MPATAEQCRRYRAKLRKRALYLIGRRCVFCAETFDLHAAHIAPTSVDGSSRGSTKRYIDVIRNYKHYRPMCALCHRTFDALLRAREVLPRTRYRSE